MNETVKLIIEIPKEAKQAFDKAESNDLKGGYYDHGGIIGKAIQNGIPLNDVKKEIETNLSWDMFDEYGNETRLHKELMEVLNNIGKGDSE